MLYKYIQVVYKFRIIYITYNYKLLDIIINNVIYIFNFISLQFSFYLF